jgi:hypothetical protein
MKRKTKHSKPAVSVDTFREDPLYPRIARAAEQLLARGKVVAPVDVLVRMHLLAPERLEDWRRGRVPYLEKIIGCNLTRLSRLLRILRFHAHDLELVPSITVYTRWGRGPKQRLRFTKTADPKLEEAYARHFVWPGKGPFHPPPSCREEPPDGDVPGREAADNR